MLFHIVCAHITAFNHFVKNLYALQSVTSYGATDIGLSPGRIYFVSLK